MANRPTPGGSDGTWGTELNAHLDVSLASDGKIKDGAVFSTSAAPSVDAGVANKLYVDRGAASVAKAWCQVRADGTLESGSFNVASITKEAGNGHYTVTWDTDFANALYAPVVTPISSSAGTVRHADTHSVVAGSCGVGVVDAVNTLADTAFCIIAFGT